MFFLFNALLAPFLPALWLYTLHRRFVQRKSVASFRAQWGHISPSMHEFGAKIGPRIWLHAVSVGETMAAKPIARALKNEIEGVQIALSSTTDTGHGIAQSLQKNGEVDCVFYFPLDLAPVQNRVLDALHPDAILFVETELWPNLLHLARKRGIPTFLVNGRVSDNLLQTAPKLGPLWGWMSGNVTQFLMRGDEDGARLESLGVPKAKICVTGDVKLEAPPLSSEQLRGEWRAKLGLSETEKVLVCGSTHQGEEVIWLEIARLAPGWKVAFAPRHPNRFDAVAQLIANAGFALVRRSEKRKWDDGTVFLLDSVGELSDFYALGDAAFVGGSWIPRGGHNLLEPILRGVPVLFGESVNNFLAQSQLILANQLGEMTANPHSAAKLHNAKQEIAEWLNGLSPDRAAFARRVEQGLSPHRGAAMRLAQCVGDEIHRKTKK